MVGVAAALECPAGSIHACCQLVADVLCGCACCAAAGDTVVFERRGEERRMLYVSVVKGDGPPAADAPPSKRKRVSRAQAVQRLE
jgi:hypothetical protein